MDKIIEINKKVKGIKEMRGKRLFLR